MESQAKNFLTFLTVIILFYIILSNQHIRVILKIMWHWRLSNDAEKFRFWSQKYYTLTYITIENILYYVYSSIYIYIYIYIICIYFIIIIIINVILFIIFEKPLSLVCFNRQFNCYIRCLLITVLVSVLYSLISHVMIYLGTLKRSLWLLFAPVRCGSNLRPLFSEELLHSWMFECLLWHLSVLNVMKTLTCWIYV